MHVQSEVSTCIPPWMEPYELTTYLHTYIGRKKEKQGENREENKKTNEKEAPPKNVYM